MDEKDILSKAGIDNFNSVTDLASAYKNTVSEFDKFKSTSQSAPDWVNMSSSEKLKHAFPDLGRSTLSGSQSELANKLVTQYNIPAELVDSVVSEISKSTTTKTPEAKTSVGAAVDTYLKDAENTSALARYATSKGMNIEQFEFELEAGDIPLDLVKKYVAAGKRLEVEEGDSGVEISADDVSVQSNNAMDIVDDILDKKREILYDVKHPQHKKVVALYNKACKLVGLPGVQTP